MMLRDANISDSCTFDRLCFPRLGATVIVAVPNVFLAENDSFSLVTAILVNLKLSEEISNKDSEKLLSKHPWKGVYLR